MRTRTSAAGAGAAAGARRAARFCPSSRTPRRIFATLAGDGRDVSFMFDPFDQDAFCEMARHAFAPVPGGSGHMGATRCDLKQVDERTFLAVSEGAHAPASAPRKKRRPR